MTCSECKDGAATAGTRPFCEIIRNSGKYAPLVKEDRFLATVLRIIDPAETGSIVQTGDSFIRAVNQLLVDPS